MWSELFIWLERYSGVSYDFSEDIASIKGDIAFIDTYEWFNVISNLFDNLSEAIDVVDEFGDNLTDELPNKKKVKNMLTSYVISNLLDNVNDIKRKLNIDIVDISNSDTLIQHINIIMELIQMLSENEMDDIFKQQLFEKHEEENGNTFTEILNIQKDDITNMYFTVSSIQQDYFDSLDEN
jgi:hypothetical protein